MNSTNLIVIFLTGLTTGGLTCLAIQGGLLASVLAGQKSQHQFAATTSFLLSKLVFHTLLGFVLGLLGTSLQLNPITKGWFQVIIGFYLFGVAGSLLEIHPAFRYFVIKPPKFLAKLAKNSSQSQSLFAPAVLGALTIFLPCATTQAMEILALGTANPWSAAGIMFAFILGTTPTFLIFGLLLKQGSSWLKDFFPKIAAAALIVMSVYSLNSGIGLMGSIYTLQNFWAVASNNIDPSTQSVLGDKTQSVVINVSNSGYSPRNITLKKGIPATITLITKNTQSCSRAFTIPSLNISKILPETGTTTVEFTPTQTGPLVFSCSMGMYTGQFNIVN